MKISKVGEVQIDYTKFLKMLDRLEHRISERFPNDIEPGIQERVREVVATAARAPKARHQITRPLWAFRLIVAISIAFCGYLGYRYAGEIQLSFKDASLSDIIQAADSAKNLLFALLAVILSMFFWERSWKRGIASRYLDQLIALGHVINVAQQAKDPERLNYTDAQRTEASPDLGGCTNAFLLGRWLDYANEMVGVLPTLAAYVSAGVTDTTILAKKQEVHSVSLFTAQNLRHKITTLATMFPVAPKAEPTQASLSVS